VPNDDRMTIGELRKCLRPMQKRYLKASQKKRGELLLAASCTCLQPSRRTGDRSQNPTEPVGESNPVRASIFIPVHGDRGEGRGGDRCPRG